MLKHVAKTPDLFLAAVDRNTGRIAEFLNGLSCCYDWMCFQSIGCRDWRGRLWIATLRGNVRKAGVWFC